MQLLWNLLFDILIPAWILSIWVANWLYKKQFDVKKLRVSSDEDTVDLNPSNYFEKLMTSSLLPLSFFVFARRLISFMVAEKEKGLLQYLQMNGMSKMAYHLSFVLHEAFVNGPLICIALDAIVWYKYFHKENRVMDPFISECLLRLNGAVLFFITGITALCILISKMFNSASFATQIGSMLYLVPVILILYVNSLEMKHRYSKTMNEEYTKMVN